MTVMKKGGALAFGLFWVTGLGLVPLKAQASPCGEPKKLVAPIFDTDGRYPIIWRPSTTTGVSYELQEATNPAFIGDAHTIYSGSDPSKALAGRRQITTYYYRVRAKKAGHSASPWKSAAQGVAVPGTQTARVPPAITVPAYDQDGSYQVTWASSPTPGINYLLEEATDAAFTNGRRVAYFGPALHKNISERTMGDTYYYRVRAVKQGLRDSAWKTGGNGCEMETPPVVTSPPDTGQDKCYNNTMEIPCPSVGQPFYGQDAQYSRPRLFIDNGNGTVDDTVTGLVWQREMPTESYKWEEAQAYCADLSLAEASDWRLPSIKELSLLVDSSMYNHAIDTLVFPDLTMFEIQVWSSTPYAPDPTYAWIVHFSSGHASGNGEYKARSYDIRCVRGGK